MTALGRDKVPLRDLVGRELKAISFREYSVTFDFELPYLVAYSTVYVQPELKTLLSPGDIGWRDALCACITDNVEDVELQIGEAIWIFFESGPVIYVSLRRDEAEPPIAALLAHNDGVTVFEFGARHPRDTQIANMEYLLRNLES
jgi:hypothetical protein